MNQAEEDREPNPVAPLDEKTMEAIVAAAVSDVSDVSEASVSSAAEPRTLEPVVERCGRLNLDVFERLRLFQGVCLAVHRAHQRGRIFGDLRPERLVVGETGEPLEPACKESGPPIALDEYTSPEQVMGEPLTTAADVYALGAVLYQLLTDQPPIKADPSDASATAQAICEQAPERPSRAAPASRRRRIGIDLDSIVLAAIRKEPDRRPASASALAEDLEAYLAGLPVRAGETSEWGRVARFARRRAWVPVLLTLMAAVAAAWAVWQVRETRVLRRERDQSVAQTETAVVALETALDRLIQEEAEEDPAAMRRELLKDARAYYEGIASRPEEPRRSVAVAVLHAAVVDRALGRNADAAAGFLAASGLWKSLVDEHPDDPASALRLAEAHAGLGRSLDPGTKGPKAEAALDALDAARQGFVGLVDAISDEPQVRRELAQVLRDQAAIQRRLGRPSEASTSIRSAIRLLEELTWAAPGMLETRLALAASFGLLAQLQSERESGLAAAMVSLDRAIQVLTAAPGAGKDSPRLKLDLAARLVDLADVQSTAGAIREASETIGRAMTILEALVDQHPGEPSYRGELALAYNLDAELLRDRNRRSDAAARAGKAEKLLERLIVERPEERRHISALAASRQIQGKILAQEGRTADALKTFQTAADLLESVKDRQGADSYSLACSISLGLSLVGVKEGGRPIENDASLPQEDRIRRELYSRRAIAALRQAVADGYDDYDLYRLDPALNPLRSRGDFKKLLAKLAEPEPAGDSP